MSPPAADSSTPPTKRPRSSATDAAPGEFPRTVEHANGTTEIEAKPERVVVLDTGELDDVIALGITPVGMVTTKGANPVPSYLAEKTQGVETVGTISELDLEKIASLEPDLILGSQRVPTSSTTSCRRSLPRSSRSAPASRGRRTSSSPVRRSAPRRRPPRSSTSTGGR